MQRFASEWVEYLPRINCVPVASGSSSSGAGKIQCALSHSRAGGRNRELDCDGCFVYLGDASVASRVIRCVSAGFESAGRTRTDCPGEAAVRGGARARWQKREYSLPRRSPAWQRERSELSRRALKRVY